MRALFDLLFPASCAGCARPGAVVCVDCAHALRGEPALRMPTPCPDDLPPAYAVADYAGTARALVLAYKERDAVALTRPLATALAASIDAAAMQLPTQRLPLVVPVPSTRDALRRRGFDPVLRLARATRRGAVRTVLAHRRGVADSAGLSAVSRHRNMAGALHVPSAVAASVRGRTVLVVDDVITTGATLAEAARALREVGASVAAVAVIAATVRHGASPADCRVDLPNRGSPHYCS